MRTAIPRRRSRRASLRRATVPRFNPHSHSHAPYCNRRCGQRAPSSTLAASPPLRNRRRRMRGRSLGRNRATCPPSAPPDATLRRPAETRRLRWRRRRQRRRRRRRWRRPPRGDGEGCRAGTTPALQPAAAAAPRRRRRRRRGAAATTTVAGARREPESAAEVADAATAASDCPACAGRHRPHTCDRRKGRKERKRDALSPVRPERCAPASVCLGTKACLVRFRLPVLGCIGTNKFGFIIPTCTAALAVRAASWVIGDTALTESK